MTRRQTVAEFRNGATMNAHARRNQHREMVTDWDSNSHVAVFAYIPCSPVSSYAHLSSSLS